MQVFNLFIPLILHLNYVSTFPTGAPTTVCDSQAPQHGTNAPQTGGLPGQITVTPTTAQPGSVVTVMISATHRGILLQARLIGSNARIGEWVSVPSGYKIITCSSGGAAITHTSNSDKQIASFSWRAPSNLVSGSRIQFYFTVVQDYVTYWVGQVGPMVTIVGGNVIVTTPQPTTPVGTTLSPLAGMVDLNLCGQGTKSCFYYTPDDQTNCGNNPSNCQFKMTIQPTTNAADTVRIDMGGNVGGASSIAAEGRWLALGISGDTSMGDDDVLACVLAPGGVSVSLVRYWNPGGHTTPVRQTNNPASLTTWRYQDGYMYCQFVRLVAPLSTAFPHTRNISQPQHVMFTWGPVNAGGNIGRHIPSSPARTSSPVQIAGSNPQPVSLNLESSSYSGWSMSMILTGALVGTVIGIVIVAVLVWFMFG